MQQGRAVGQETWGDGHQREFLVTAGDNPDGTRNESIPFGRLEDLAECRVNRAFISTASFDDLTRAGFGNADHGTGSMSPSSWRARRGRFVGLDFMELRYVPLPLPAVFEGYCVTVWTLLSGPHLWL